jgi:hypothetical protein
MDKKHMITREQAKSLNPGNKIWYWDWTGPRSKEVVDIDDRRRFVRVKPSGLPESATWAEHALWIESEEYALGSYFMVESYFLSEDECRSSLERLMDPKAEYQSG